ncbi:MFS transporter [Thermogemmatispora sp.]|uniref:MFS transporter n=1 Tax=Thermogemmatispora sp. TaxID=1968838 RepID=UPI001DE453E8|nr:MFS transporter [Thermogemmatispora sp.]MBX5451711.1 MFS transporter [Thermogemmatispora sp.]
MSDTTNISPMTSEATESPQGMQQKQFIGQRPVSWLFGLTYLLANLAGNSVLLPVIIFLVPYQVNLLDPTDHVTSLALVQSIGAIFALLATPLAGAISDRTRARFGKRRLWLFVHMLCACMALLLLRFAPTIFLIVVGWSLLQFFGGALLTVLQAIIPDRVPLNQRGFISALVGLAIPFAAVLGGLLIAVIFRRNYLAAYYPLSAALILSILLCLLVYHEEMTLDQPPSSFRLKTFLARFLVNPRKHPDFAWAFVTRLLLFLAYFAVATYIQYYIKDGLHYEQLFPGKKVLDGTLAVQSIETLLILICSFGAGWLSDRLGRRKPFVIAAAFLVMLALLTPVWLPTWSGVQLFAALLGAGYGAYLAVDTALITQVLPSAADYGRDLGLINLALSIPLIVSPLLGGLLINSLGYSGLFIAGAGIALLSALMVLPIKSVR